MGRKAQNKENNVFGYIIQYKTDNDGLSPSYREICKELNIRSVSTVYYYIRKLEKQGKIAMGKKASGIKVIGGRWILE